MRILIVGTDTKIIRPIQRRLSRDGFGIDLFETFADDTMPSHITTSDVLILEDRLPGQDARLICRRLRSANHHKPVMVVSSRVSVSDRVRGLDAGADDYVTIPFSVNELAARIRALLRRNGHSGVRALGVGNLVLDPITRCVTRAGRQINLTAREFSVLKCLMRHQGRPVSREMIAIQAWNREWDGLTNEIDVFVSRLRKKTERPFERRLIHSIRGVGYAIGSGAEQ